MDKMTVTFDFESVTADGIYDAIKRLPADVYLELYHRMQVEIGYNPAPTYYPCNPGTYCGEV